MKVIDNKKDDEHHIDNLENLGRKGVYLIPNLLTTSALFAGFYAIISSINGNYIYACIAIFIAQLLDGADGRVARMTHTQSEFGAQYDSMSDVMAFGLAPAILAFQWALQDLDTVGWVAAFIYVAGAALRLARFNVQIGKIDKKYFIGLASPAAAAVIWSTIWSMEKFGVSGGQISWLMAIITPLIGVMMVSPVRYFSFKDISAQRRVPFFGLLAIVMVFALVALDPARVLFGFAITYALHGPILELWKYVKRKKLETSS
ncbi:CDP-diacylglycerol--serine O-phosphatidyltransferase [Reinekea thalattae]|uniref:CDP-diacylglycerol--serine O-phosphatidyltransferase n=1 Tax=Reinekea thalattae TaxID=2593301 RepID=A0A5C8Z3Q9_9GAMM|nr:CDP-diacylglycerol--serine O-phosphatidyltransferase [Reinekea thalattae]TXR51546.1 CDP-diacylglycerol--serine O-phosphatidyltransferase [Reinekea thalattae]